MPAYNTLATETPTALEVSPEGSTAKRSADSSPEDISEAKRIKMETALDTASGD
jgi:hypothetical protein